jgi:hypothetical protein
VSSLPAGFRPTCGLASLSEDDATRRLSLAASVGPRAWALAVLP